MNKQRLQGRFHTRHSRVFTDSNYQHAFVLRAEKSWTERTVMFGQPRIVNCDFVARLTPPRRVHVGGGMWVNRSIVYPAVVGGFAGAMVAFISGMFLPLFLGVVVPPLLSHSWVSMRQAHGLGLTSLLRQELQCVNDEPYRVLGTFGPVPAEDVPSLQWGGAWTEIPRDYVEVLRDSEAAWALADRMLDLTGEEQRIRGLIREGRDRMRTAAGTPVARSVRERLEELNGRLEGVASDREEIVSELDHLVASRRIAETEQWRADAQERAQKWLDDNDTNDI